MSLAYTVFATAIGECALAWSDAGIAAAWLPEMDGFGWFTIDRLGELCTSRMAAVLVQALDGGRIMDALAVPPPARLAA